MSRRDPRPEMILTIVESVLGQSLAFVLEKPSRAVMVTDRSEIFESYAKSKGGVPPVFSNGRNDWSTGVSLMQFDSRRVLEVTISLPTRLALEHGEALLRQVGPPAIAWWGGVNLPDLLQITSQQSKSPLPDSDDVAPPFELPWLTAPFRLGVPSRPPELFWLNYWCDEAAKMVGFDEKIAREVFATVRRIDGGWLLRLTEEPFDPGRNDHISRLVAGYQHFEGVGRIPPTDRRA